MIDGGLNKLFQNNWPQVHWQRVESGPIGAGTPDLNGCVQGVEFWLELKRADHWTIKVKPEQRASQIAWAERRIRAGGLVRMACRRAEKELWLMDGRATRFALTGSLQNVPVALIIGVWHGGPAGWNWPAIQQGILFRGTASRTQ